MININISYGEFFDKISILEIKKNKINNKENLKIINLELSFLNKQLHLSKINFTTIQDQFKNLKKINEELWEIEDKIREKERKQIFDKTFVQLARNVYKTNDKRAKLKKDIDLLLKSEFFEVKSYTNY